MSGKKVTVRKQKIKKNHIREKLIFFTILTLILLIVAAVARKLCPYDPYAQDLLLAQKPPVRNIFWEQTVMEEICFQSSGGKYNKYLCDALACCDRYGYRNCDRMICGWCGGIADTVLMRISDLFLAFPSLVFALAVAGFLAADTECDYCTGSNRLAEICKTCKGTDTGTERFAYLMAVKMSGSSVPKIFLNIFCPILQVRFWSLQS